MLRTATIFGASAVLLALSGYVHGLWTDRWQASPELEQALSRLERFPAVVGELRGEAQELDARAVKQAGFRGYVLRRYDDRRTGGTVAVLLGCGRPGPLSVHTPDVCYRGAGYRQVGPAEKRVLGGERGGPRAELWTARFSKGEGAAASHLRIYWGWSARGAWQAPGSPRLAFAGAPALYKLYVISQAPDAAEEADDGPGAQFLRQLLPELHRALFAGP